MQLLESQQQQQAQAPPLQAGSEDGQALGNALAELGSLAQASEEQLPPIAPHKLARQSLGCWA